MSSQRSVGIVHRFQPPRSLFMTLPKNSASNRRGSCITYFVGPTSNPPRKNKNKNNAGLFHKVRRSSSSGRGSGTVRSVASPKSNSIQSNTIDDPRPGRKSLISLSLSPALIAPIPPSLKDACVHAIIPAIPYPTLPIPPSFQGQASSLQLKPIAANRSQLQSKPIEAN